MRRRNLLVVAGLLAAGLISLSGAGTAVAGASSSSSFTGKASVYYRNAGPYFVVNFTCSGGTFSGNWTYAVYNGGSKKSYSGTLGVGAHGKAATCALIPGTRNTAGLRFSSSDGTTTGPFTPTLVYQGSTVGALTLSLWNIGATKIYVHETSRDITSSAAFPCPAQDTPNPSCIQITATFSSKLSLPSFDSSKVVQPYGLPYGTLDLTLPKP